MLGQRKSKSKNEHLQLQKAWKSTSYRVDNVRVAQGSELKHVKHGSQSADVQFNQVISNQDINYTCFA